MQDNHARILLRKLVADCAAPIRTPVIDQQDLEIREALGQYTVNALLQIRSYIVNRYDDRQTHHCSKLPNFLSSSENLPITNSSASGNSQSCAIKS